MLRGVGTISFWAEDVEAAKDWYAELLGVQPYFERKGPDGKPAYYEFRIGDFQVELGLIDARYRPPGASGAAGGAILNWAVDDAHAAFERLKAMGAKELEGIIERGEGWITASVIDPFGNIVGVVKNPHYEQVVGSLTS
jgi:predicted enzyme related to lactoylglutathione lyase